MTLVEHLRELRNRLFWSFVAIARRRRRRLGLLRPALQRSSPSRSLDASSQLVEAGHHKPILSLTGVADAFNLRLQVSLAAGIILTSPIWIYQLLRFVTPGLHKNERRWAADLRRPPPSRCSWPASRWRTSPCRTCWARSSGSPRAGRSNIIDVENYVSFLLQISSGVRHRVPGAGRRRGPQRDRGAVGATVRVVVALGALLRPRLRGGRHADRRPVQHAALRHAAAAADGRGVRHLLAQRPPPGAGGTPGRARRPVRRRDSARWTWPSSRSTRRHRSSASTRSSRPLARSDRLSPAPTRRR